VTLGGVEPCPCFLYLLSSFLSFTFCIGIWGPGFLSLLERTCYGSSSPTFEIIIIKDYFYLVWRYRLGAEECEGGAEERESARLIGADWNLRHYYLFVHTTGNSLRTDGGER
jgi:hypothetical protein